MVSIRTAGPKIGPQDVAAVEAKLARRLPNGYKQFLLEYNGGVPEPNQFDVPGARTSSGVNRFYAILDGEVDGDLIYEQRLLRGYLPSGIMAIADAEGGNHVCLSVRGEDYGSVFFRDHELASEANVAAGLFELKPSFELFLSDLRKFDPESVKLTPGQVEKAWIDPEFVKNLKK